MWCEDRDTGWKSPYWIIQANKHLDIRLRICNLDYMASTEGPISRVLREAIAESGLSFKRLEKETGVLRQSLMKFCREEQSLRGDCFDRLAEYFNLELRPKRKG